MPKPDLPELLVLYDGECGLCDRSVRFLLDKDRERNLVYAPLQGATAATLLDRHPDLEGMDSIVFVRKTEGGEEVFAFSSAVAEICRELPWPWKGLRLLVLFPRPLRDFVYRAVAKRRLRFFGGAEACRLPTLGEKERFLR
jgi:predicted DCC family thiol-disulfide oxidoreductase YuxK